nr:MAG TPA: hypothetical protein [Caudoviricetes sp.]
MSACRPLYLEDPGQKVSHSGPHVIQVTLGNPKIRTGRDSHLVDGPGRAVVPLEHQLLGFLGYDDPTKLVDTGIRQVAAHHDLVGGRRVIDGIPQSGGIRKRLPAGSSGTSGLRPFLPVRGFLVAESLPCAGYQPLADRLHKRLGMGQRMGGLSQRLVQTFPVQCRSAFCRHSAFLQAPQVKKANGGDYGHAGLFPVGIGLFQRQLLLAGSDVFQEVRAIFPLFLEGQPFIVAAGFRIHQGRDGLHHTVGADDGGDVSHQLRHIRPGLRIPVRKRVPDLSGHGFDGPVHEAGVLLLACLHIGGVQQVHDMTTTAQQHGDPFFRVLD